MTPRDAAADVMAVGGFDGDTYDDRRDRMRLAKQLDAVRRLLSGGEWLTLYDLHRLTGDPEQSVSARLRDLRKPRFGGYTIEKRYRANGIWEYRMAPTDLERAA